MKVPSELLRQVVTVAPYEGNQGDGDVYGTPVTYKADVSFVRNLKRSGVTGGSGGMAGRTAIVKAVVVLRPEAVVKVNDRVTLPGGTVGSALTVGSVVGATGRAAQVEVEVG